MPDGDPNRGATAAAFALFMAKEGKLAYGTIQGYIWGWEQHHLNNGRHTPLDNVQDWARWMRALEVQIYVPSEPTLMVPFLLLSRALCKTNVKVFWEGLPLLSLAADFVARVLYVGLIHTHFAYTSSQFPMGAPVRSSGDLCGRRLAPRS